MSEFNEKNPLNREKAVTLPTGYPLNSLRIAGVYFVTDPVDGPSAGEFMVSVYTGARSYGGSAVQVAINLPNSIMYIRARSNTGWPAWLEIGGGIASDTVAYDPLTGTPQTLDYIASQQSGFPDIITTFSAFAQTFVTGTAVANNLEALIHAIGCAAVGAYNFGVLRNATLPRFVGTANRDPLGTDDFTKYYDRVTPGVGTIPRQVGHLWYNSVNQSWWLCVDNGDTGGPGTAVWRRIRIDRDSYIHLTGGDTLPGNDATAYQIVLQSPVTNYLVSPLSGGGEIVVPTSGLYNVQVRCDRTNLADYYLAAGNPGALTSSNFVAGSLPGAPLLPLRRNTFSCPLNLSSGTGIGLFASNNSATSTIVGAIITLTKIS